MKSILTWIIALITAIGLCPITARITNLDRQNDIVTIEMANGHIYQFYGCEDYCEGDYVSAILWRNGTDVVTDDVIVSVHYSGYSNYSGEPLE